MANQWYRQYSKFSDDPDVQMLPENMQRRLVMLFCERCKEEELTDTERAFHWRVSDDELQMTKKVFIERGFIDENWEVLKWAKRQFLSDSSKERVNRFREKRMRLGMPKVAPKLDDDSLFLRDSNRCIYCMSRLHLCLDHIYPICMGGDDSSDNLGVSCKRCNAGKSGRTPEMSGYAIQNEGAKARYESYVSRMGLAETVTPKNVTVTETNCDVTVTAPEQKQKQNREDLFSSVDKPPVERKRATGKKIVDPRFVEFVKHIDSYWKYVHGSASTLPAGPAMGKQLNTLLAKYPGLTSEGFHQALGNRALSENCNQSAEPAQYIPRINLYFAGPLDKYGHPMQIEVETQDVKGID